MPALTKTRAIESDSSVDRAMTLRMPPGLPDMFELKLVADVNALSTAKGRAMVYAEVEDGAGGWMDVAYVAMDCPFVLPVGRTPNMSVVFSGMATKQRKTIRVGVKNTTGVDVGVEVGSV